MDAQARSCSYMKRPTARTAIEFPAIERGRSPTGPGKLQVLTSPTRSAARLQQDSCSTRMLCAEPPFPDDPCVFPTDSKRYFPPLLQIGSAYMQRPPTQSRDIATPTHHQQDQPGRSTSCTAFSHHPHAPSRSCCAYLLSPKSSHGGLWQSSSRSTTVGRRGLQSRILIDTPTARRGKIVPALAADSSPTRMGATIGASPIDQASLPALPHCSTSSNVRAADARSGPLTRQPVCLAKSVLRVVTFGTLVRHARHRRDPPAARAGRELVSAIYFHLAIAWGCRGVATHPALARLPQLADARQGAMLYDCGPATFRSPARCWPRCGTWTRRARVVDAWHATGPHRKCGQCSRAARVTGAGCSYAVVR